MWWLCSGRTAFVITVAPVHCKYGKISRFSDFYRLRWHMLLWDVSLFTASLFVQLYWELLLRKLLHYRHFCACVSWKWKGSRHFRLTPGLWIKTRLSAQPLIWKWFFILMQIKLIFTRKASQKVLFFTATFSTPLLTFLISGLESKFIRQQSIEEIGSVTYLDDHWSFNLSLLTPLLTVWLKSSHKKDGLLLEIQSGGFLMSCGC